MSYEPGSMYFDSNGVLTEHRMIDGIEVIVHYDDLPEGDLTVVDGIPCTTALRTVIDLAVDLDAQQLVTIVRDALDRGLFTREEASARLDQPDMRGRLGAALVKITLQFA